MKISWMSGWTCGWMEGKQEAEDVKWMGTTLNQRGAASDNCIDGSSTDGRVGDRKLLNSTVRVQTSR